MMQPDFPPSMKYFMADRTIGRQFNLASHKLLGDYYLIMQPVANEESYKSTVFFFLWKSFSIEARISLNVIILLALPHNNNTPLAGLVLIHYSVVHLQATPAKCPKYMQFWWRDFRFVHLTLSWFWLSALKNTWVCLQQIGMSCSAINLWCSAMGVL